MSKKKGAVRYIQGVFDNTTKKFLGISDPNTSGDGVDYTVGILTDEQVTAGATGIAAVTDDGEFLGKNGVVSGLAITPSFSNDGEYNSTLLQSIIDTYSETNAGSVIFPKGEEIPFSDGISFNAGVVAINLNGSTMDFSSLLSGFAITITPPLDPHADVAHLKDIICNGKIVGADDDTVSADGISIDRKTAGTGVLSGLAFRNLIVQGFRDNLYYGSGAYINHFYNCSLIKAHRYNLNYPALTYAGENLSFFGGRISDSSNAGGNGTGIYMPEGGINQLHLFGTSVDYNQINGVIKSGRVKIFGGNLENNTSLPMWYLDASGAGDFIEFTIESDISMTESSPGRASLIQSTGDRVFIDISKAFIYAYNATTELVNVVSGSPQVTYSGAKVLSTGASGLQPKISAYTNEVSQSQDLSTPSTSGWVAASGNVTLSVGTGLGYVSGNAIQAQYTGSASTSAYYTLNVKPGQIVLYEFMSRLSALTSGSGVTPRIRFFDYSGGLISSTDLASLTAVSGSYSKQSTWKKAPKGAATVRLDFWSASATTILIDDVKAWAY